jgi:superfamily II DNA or RNA helicase
MPDIVKLIKHTAVHDRIEADKGLIQEIADQFTFFVPNYQFNPKFKNKVWDGKIRLTSVYRPLIYSGLRQKIKEFCEVRDYQFVDEASFHFDPVTEDDLWSFIESLNLPSQMNGKPFSVRTEQIEACLRAINDQRLTVLAPTGSGKSLILYIITRFFNLKTLLIVPTINLVDQMTSDWNEYGFDTENNVHKIFGGQSKVSDKLVAISTWQSLKDMDEDYLSQFHVVLCDEVHGAKAKEITGIMERMPDCEIRIGCTGSLDGTQVNELVIQGLFGPIIRVATTSELQEQGKLARLKINCIVLNYGQADRKELKRIQKPKGDEKKADYQREIDYIVTLEKRNQFIKNLALSLKGNTMVLFRFVEKHGEVLQKMIEAEAKIPVLYVSGKVEKDEREIIRKFVNEQTDSIVIASSVFMTGTNIPNLDNIIFTSPSKARIQILQAIGRTLRTTARKAKAVLYDIADELHTGSRMNYTLDHFIERVKLYNQEHFPYKVFRIDI